MVFDEMKLKINYRYGEAHGSTGFVDSEARSS